MKRLLSSSKFWSTVIGVAASAVLYKWIGDGTYASLVLGAFSAITFVNGAEDVVSKYKVTKIDEAK